MKILITGGSGFIGQRLANRLLQLGSLQLQGHQHSKQTIENITLTDLAAPPAWEPGLADHAAIACYYGDLSERSFVQSLFSNTTYDVVFHLASIVSAHGETDFDLALRVNLDGTRTLFDYIRAQPHSSTGNPSARVVFTSSMAAFGGDSMPATVSDHYKQTATTTYGMTKTIGELLINDYSRKQFFDGRTARLPTVIIRPGKPNKAASSFVSGLFREPLNGQDCTIPVDPSMPMAILGYRSIVDGMIRLAEIDSAELGHDKAVGLPAINSTVQQLMDGLINSVKKPSCQPPLCTGTLGHHRLQPDAEISRICGGWPSAADNSRALALGLPIEDSIETIVRYYIEDYL